MRTSEQHSVRALSAGFTLVEMLVAVGVGAALVASAAGVFALASQSIGSSQANVEISSNLRTVCSWLQRDFNCIRLDGPLVIIPDGINYTKADGSIQTARLDQILFFISGNIPALTTSDRVSLALLMYGHDSTADALAGPSWQEMRGLSFTRWARLILSDSPPPPSSEFYGWTASFGDLIALWYLDHDALFIDPFRDRPDVSAGGSERFAQMLPRTTSFAVIQYYMPGDTDPTPVNPGAVISFAPNQPKPAWIDFEITVCDSANRIRDGYTATYRVNLPSRL